MTIRPPKRSLAALIVGAALLSSACSDDSSVVADTNVGPSDTGDAGDLTDTGPDVPAQEDLRIAYTMVSTFDDDLPTRLMVVDSDCRAGSADLCEPGICDPVEIEPLNATEPLCNRGCQVSGDFGHVVFLDPVAPKTLRSVPLGDDFQPTADSNIIATSVDEYQVRRGTVVYQVGTDLHVYDLATGADSVAATLAGSGGFHLSDDASRLFVSTVTSLTAMQTNVVDLATGTELPVFHFVSGEEQGTGSFFSGRERMAVSPDGTRLAVITNARTSGAECASNADCTAPGEGCLTSALPPRCVKQELTMNIINLDATDQLRTRCSSDADCGADHFCDVSAVDSSGLGECLPGRFSLGPSGPGACTTLQLGQYSGVVGDIGWRGDRTVVGVFSQECIRGNIAVTDVVALNLDGAAFERIVENPGVDHGGCYDEVEGCFDTEACNIEIEGAFVSESGGTVALVADSVSTSHKSELWLVDGWARDGKQLLSRSSDWEVRTVTLHPEE